MMIKYIFTFKAMVLDFEREVTKQHIFHCSIVLYPDSYPREVRRSDSVRLSDIALFHAWCKASQYLHDGHMIPLSVSLEDTKEVKENA